MMYSMFYELESAVKASVAQANYSEALDKLKQFVETVMNIQAAPGDVVGARKLDKLCELVGDSYYLREFAKPKDWFPAEDKIVIVCTGLYKYGGTSLLISDLAKAHPNHQCTVLATNFLDDMNAEDLELSRIGESGAAVSICPPGSGEEKLNWLIQQFTDIAPSRIFLLNHHQDSVIIAAARPFVEQLKVIFYHHADYNICLGVHLKGALHVDPHNVGYYNCRTKERIANNVYVPLVVDDKGSYRADTEFMSDGELTTCSSGHYLKFRNFYLYPYAELLVDRLKARGGEHIHIGGLPAEDIAHIRQKLARHGVDTTRFNHIPWTASLWQTLIDRKVDLFIGSFPIGGARTTIEAMGAGIPILMPDNYLSRFFSSRDIVYREALVWKYPEDFVKIISDVNSRVLTAQSLQSRDHYLRNYSSKSVDIAGKLNAICAGDPIPAPYELYPYDPDHLDKALHFGHLDSMTSSYAVRNALDMLAQSSEAVPALAPVMSQPIGHQSRRGLLALSSKIKAQQKALFGKIRRTFSKQKGINRPKILADEDTPLNKIISQNREPDITHLSPQEQNLYREIQKNPDSIGFNADTYLLHNLDVKHARMDPLLHFVEYGQYEGRGSSFFFSQDWHAEMNMLDRNRSNDILHRLVHTRSNPTRRKVAVFGYAWNIARRPDAYIREMVAALADLGINVDVYIGGHFAQDEGTRGFRPDLNKADLNAFLRAQSYDFAISFNNALVMPETVDALSCTIVSVIVDSIHHLFDHTEGGLWQPFTLPIHAAPIYTALLEDIKAVDGVRASASFMPAATQIEGRQMKAGEQPIAISWIASMLGDHNLDNFMSRVEDEIPDGLKLITRCLSDIEQFGEIAKNRASQDAARLLCEWSDWDYPLLEMHLQEVVTNGERLAVVERLAPLGLKIFGNSRWRTALSLSPNVARAFQSGAALRRHADLCAIYDRSKISINLPQIHAGTGMQYRILDILASKSLLITKHIAGSDMERLFGPDSPVVTFSDLDDLENKCAYYLENEKERLARVKACNAMVAKGFSFKERVLEYLELSNPSQAHHAGAIKERGSVSLIWPDRVIDWAARREPEAA
jgi:hypothetical protein